VSAAELHHRVDGPDDAPVLVLAPSLGTTLELWEAQLPALAARRRVVRVDLPGHGSSPIPAGPTPVQDMAAGVLAILDDLEIERASLCGVSLGGAMAMWLAASAPDRVDRLVLCCTAARFPYPELYRERATMVRSRGLDAVADGVLSRWFTPAFHERAPKTVARYRAMLTATPPEGYALCCEAVSDFDARDRLGSIEAPTLVLAGALDPALPPEHAHALGQGIPGASLTLVAQAAHIPNVEQPDRVTAAIIDHLDGGR
jgi:3-oxoadipate enol-lactonase